MISQSQGANAAPVPMREGRRLAALHRLEVLDTLPEQMFDDIVELVASICGTPIALISLVDAQRQWFKARVGLAAQETHRDLAFCAHAILQPDEVMVVRDATLDDRFAHNALVTGAPGIRFYAGAPIVTSDGDALGTVCAIDRLPRTLEPAQRDALLRLARQAARLLEYRRRTEAHRSGMLRELDRQRQRLIQLAAVSMSSIDQQAFVTRAGQLAYVNDTFLEYWGLARDAVEGRALTEVLPPELAAQQVEHVAAAHGGASAQHEGYIAYPARGTRYMRTVYLPVHEEGGEVVGAVVRTTDLHSLKQAEAERQAALDRLAARNQAQQRFIRMISHDVREPVNTICNFSQLLQRRHGPELGADASRYLAFVHEGGTRIRTMLEDLLTLVRLDGAPIKRIEIGLLELVRAAASDLTAAIERTGAQVTYQDLPTALIDATLIRLLVQNLISNAIKFHRPGTPPVVAIHGGRDAHGWHLSVTDNGIGIAVEHQAQLFAEFKRLHTRREYEGTGLGLAICQRIAELHGGSLDVASTPGQGSTFTLRVPHRA